MSTSLSQTYLKFLGVNQHVVLSNMAGGDFEDRVNVNQDWSLSFEFARLGSTSYVHRLFSSTLRNDEVLFRASDGLFRLTFLAGSVSWSGVPIPTENTVYLINRIVGTTNFELFVNGDTQGIRTSSSGVTIFNFNIVGVNGSSGYAHGDLYNVNYNSTNSGVNLNLDPSATNGTGTVLKDTEGTNDGQLTNYTGATDTQWGGGFTRIGTLTVPSLGAGVTATNVPLAIRPQLEFTTAMLAAIKSDGGDLRLTSDETGEIELPQELVKFDKTTGDRIWSRFPDATAGVVYHVWANKASALQPEVDAAFGSQAVWVDYAVVSHDTFTESTGNPTVTAVGTITPAVGIFGDAGGAGTNGSGDGVIYTGISMPNEWTLQAWVIAGSVNGRFVSLGKVGATNNQANLQTDSAGVLEYLRNGNAPTTSTVFRDESTYSFFAARESSSLGNLIWVNDGALSQNIAHNSSFPTLDRAGIFLSADDSPFGRNPQIISEIRVSYRAKEEDQLSIEKQNQIATTAWWIAADVSNAIAVGDTRTDASGNSWAYVGSFLLEDGPSWDTSPANLNGLEAAETVFGSLTGEVYGTSTLDTTVNRNAWYDEFGGLSEELADDLAVTGFYDAAGDQSAYVDDSTSGSATYVFKRTTPSSGGVTLTASFSLPSLVVSGSITAALPQPIINGEFTLAALTVSGNVIAMLPQPVVNGSFTLPSFLTSGNVSVTLPSPELTGSFSFPFVNTSGSINAGLPAPQLSGSFAFPLITVTGNQSAEIPAPVLSASFTLPVLTITGNQFSGVPTPVLSGNVTLPLASFTSSVSAVVPLPVITGSFSLPLFTVAGVVTSNVPSPVIEGNITLPVLTTIGLVDATFSTPVSISGSFSLPNLTTEGFITVSGLVIVINSNTNINQLYLDNNIDQEYLSNNITYP